MCQDARLSRRRGQNQSFSQQYGSEARGPTATWAASRRHALGHPAPAERTPAGEWIDCCVSPPSGQDTRCRRHSFQCIRQEASHWQRAWHEQSYFPRVSDRRLSFANRCTRNACYWCIANKCLQFCTGSPTRVSAPRWLARLTSNAERILKRASADTAVVAALQTEIAPGGGFAAELPLVAGTIPKSVA